jgi:hypothetical protein
MENEEKKKKSILSIIIGIILVAMFAAWAFMLLSDYNNVKQSIEPKYCFFGKKEEKESLGKITTYMCLGYKVVFYQKEDSTLTEFNPLWEKNKKLEDINR